MDSNQTPKTPEAPAVDRAAPCSHSEDDYISQLFTNWCECAPYGEQVPKEWPHLMTEFVREHKDKQEEHMEELLMEASPDDPFERLLMSIFRMSCQFVINDLSNAVYDRNYAKLGLIGLNENRKAVVKQGFH